MTGSVFDRRPGELSDRELVVALAELGRAVQWYRDQRQHEVADGLTAAAAVLAGERDARAALYGELADAVAPAGEFTVE